MPSNLSLLLSRSRTRLVNMTPQDCRMLSSTRRQSYRSWSQSLAGMSGGGVHAAQGACSTVIFNGFCQYSFLFDRENENHRPYAANARNNNTAHRLPPPPNARPGRFDSFLAPYLPPPSRSSECAPPSFRGAAPPTATNPMIFLGVGGSSLHSLENDDVYETRRDDERLREITFLG